MASRARKKKSPAAKGPVKSRPNEPSPLVVGIGASAGGIDALQHFFGALPSGDNMAFVVIIHLDPEYRSNLAELLQSRTSMKVRQVTERVSIRPNCVYVIPPNKNLSAGNGNLTLSAFEKPRGQRAPIDAFFRTLAEEYGEDSVGVILSGSGTDGTLGLKVIKDRGGLVLVQDPAEAQHDSMPRSAISTRLVDLVLPVEALARKLIEYRKDRQRIQIPEQPDELPEDDKTTMHKILVLLRNRTGHDFTQYKQTTVLRRVGRRMQVNQIAELGDYLRFLRARESEAQALLTDLLICVTHFFRDHQNWNALEESIVPKLFDGKGSDDEIRVWVAGCATGEEAFSVAMLLLEQAAKLQHSPSIQIFASDIEGNALAFGRQGTYPNAIAADVPEDRLKRFFAREGDQYHVRKEVRDRVLFSRHSLFQDPPFSKLDLVVCRNVLIYMDPPLQENIFRIFHYALKPGGYLFLGTAESADSAGRLFETVDKKHRIFQRIETDQPPELPRLEFSHHDDAVEPTEKSRGQVSSGLHRMHETERHLRMLEKYAPPSVAVNCSFDLLHLSETAGRYLKRPGGNPSHDILREIRPELRAPLQRALRRAFEEKCSTSTRPVEVQFNGESGWVHLFVRPVLKEKGMEDRALVIFAEVAISEPDSGDSKDARNDPTRRELERELEYLQEQLKGITEEYESSKEEMKAANEELQSTNEEYKSTTEELETSKEELQSVNEELETVNQELNNKIEELSQANSDLQNLMATSDVKTLFLDRDLRIQRFTSSLNDIFNVVPADRGRPLAHVTHSLDYPDLSRDAEKVVGNLTPIEREVRGARDRWYLARLRPYRSVEDRIEGVVAGFVDITELKHAKEGESRLADIVAYSQDAIISKNLDGTILSWNKGAEKMYGYRAEEAVGNNISMLIPEDRKDEQARLLPKLGRGVTIKWFETVRVRKDGSRVDVSQSMSPIFSSDGTVSRVSTIGRDISELKEAERRLKEADHHKDQFLRMLGHELRNPLAPLHNSLEILKHSKTDDELRRGAEEVIERQLTHLTRLVDDLLDTARISSGRVTLRKEIVDLREIVDNVLSDYRSIAADSRELIRNSPEKAIWMKGDPLRLTQIVGNIVRNAFIFTDEGDRIFIKLESEKESGAGNATAVLTIEDSGVGMDAETLDHVFESFTRGPRTGSQARGDLGLGLAVAKGFVELHDGVIEAHSDGLGKGARIVVRLPQSNRGKTKAKKEKKGPEPSAKRRRILVIEDHPDSAEMMQTMLSLFGHEVEIAADGHAGLESARRFRPEVVFCDIRLDGDIDGYDVARTFRSDPGLNSVYLVALSGFGLAPDRARAGEAGFDTYLVKPAEPSTLKELLQDPDRFRKQGISGN